MHATLRRCLVPSFSLLCLAAVGCLQVPYCIPELHYAAGVDAKCKGDEVRAFRVDMTQKSEIKLGAGGMRGEVVDHLELSHLPTSAQGCTSTQMGVSFATGWRYVGVVNYTSSSTAHTIALRLYRPGYETISLKPGETGRELQWREAPDLAAQVKAIDDLMQGAPPQRSATVTVRQELEPGTKSTAHKNALLFGAKEYERLARSLSPTDSHEREVRSQILESAVRLRSLAGQKEAE